MQGARERVIKAFNHEEADRVPIADVFHNIELIEYYAGETLTPGNAEDLTCRAIANCVDFARHFAVPNMETRVVRDEDGFVYRLEWWTGQVLERPFKDAKGLSEIVKKDIDRIYAAIERGQLCPQATLHIQLTGENLRTPEELHDYFARVIAKMDGSFLLAPESLVGLHTAYYRAGMQLFVYLYDEDPDLVSGWLQALNDYEVYKVHRIADAKLMPVAMVADDLSYNKGLLFSREFLRKESYPRAKRLIDAWHSHGCKVIFFCDGNKWEIMDDLVALGCDCVAPLEPASNMVVKDVKNRYPQLTCCYTVDCNDLLSHGTPDQVEAEVKTAINDAASGGGFILSSSSAIHPAVKVENAVRMFETARTYGIYGRFAPASTGVPVTSPPGVPPVTQDGTPAALATGPRATPSHYSAPVEDIRQAVIEGNWQHIDELVARALDQGVKVQTIVGDGMSAAMSVVGDYFASGHYFIPNLILSAKAMKLGMEVLKPHFGSGGSSHKGLIAVGTIEGDIHDIGKNLVASMLEGAGYEILDLGVDVKVATFVNAVRQHLPDAIAMSGILTTTVNNMPRVVQALEEAGLRGSVLVAMGGTCVTRQFADDSGADIFAEDAASAVKAFDRAIAGRSH